jgi:hypothetical protein
MFYLRPSSNKTEEAIKLPNNWGKKARKRKQCWLPGSSCKFFKNKKTISKKQKIDLKSDYWNKKEIKISIAFIHVYLAWYRSKRNSQKIQRSKYWVSTSWINATKQDFENMEKGRFTFR